MKKLLAPFAILLFGVSLAMAQTPSPSPSATPTPQRDIWQVIFEKGGEYAVRISAINSVSMHDYIVDGGAKVTEVNIGVQSSALVRFYYIEPYTPQAPDGIGQSTLNAAQDRAKQVLDRANVTDVLQKVVKNYPASTHAHTVEYRLGSKETLQKLFESVQKSFFTSTPAVFKS